MGFFDDLLDDALDSLLDVGLDLAGGGSGKNRNFKKQTIAEAFTSKRLVYGEQLVPGTTIWLNAKTYDDEKNTLFLISYLASQQSDFVSEVRFNDQVMMKGVESNYQSYNSFTWRDGASDREKVAFHKVKVDSRIELAYQRAHLGLPGFVMRRGVWQYRNSSGQWVVVGTDESGTQVFGTGKFYGMTAVYLAFKYDEAIFAAGIPTLTFKIRGKVIYDPRLDASVYSNNYALCVLDFLKNIVGLTDDDLNLQSFIDGANICDEQVPTVDGDTENRFTVNGVIELDKTPLENLETLLESGGGWLSYTQGKWTLKLPVYTAPILALNDSDVIGSIRFQPKSGKQKRYNSVRGSYISAENDFDRIEAPTMSVQSYIDNDGEKLEGTFDYDLVTSGYQVQRLNKIKLEQSRYGVVLSGVFKFKALQATVGDRITLSISAFGWVNKIFQIIKYEVDYETGIKMTLREDDPSIYSWVEGEATPIEASPALNLPDHESIDGPESVVVNESLYHTNNSREIKARAVVSWTVDEDIVYKYDAEFKKVEDTDWDAIVWRYQGSRAVVYDIEPGDYEFRVRAVNDVGFFSEWTTVSATVLGKTAPPPDIESLFVDGGLLSWTYPNAPLDLLGFEVRVHDGSRQTWADAIPMHTGTISASRFTLPENISGTKTFLVKAIDTSSNESVNAAIATIGLGDASIANVILSYDYKANSWPGALTNATVNGAGELEAQQTGSFYNPDQSSVFYNQNSSSGFYDAEYKKLVYEFTYTVASIDAGSQLTISPVYDADSLQLEFIPPSMPAAAYSAFGGYIPQSEAGQYKFRLSIPSQFGSTVPTLEALSLSLDVPDITETFSDLSISSAGTRLPISKTYRGITHVTLTMQTDGSGVASLKVSDKNHTLGPLIYAYDASGAAVSTTIDAFIRGY